jgi:hypothetical protein
MINTGYKILCTRRIPYFYLLFLLTFILSFQSCQLDQTNSYKTVLCNVDTTQLDKEGKKFVISVGTLSSQDINVSGYLNTLEAHTGTHSVLLTGKRKFGLSTTFDGLHGNEYFIVSIWRKDASHKSGLIVQGDKTKTLYIAQKDAVEQGKNGWEKLEIEVEVPPNIKEVKFYVWKINADSAFFDDLEIRLLPEKEYPIYAEEPKLHLYFGKKNMRKFEAKRLRAFEDGILISDGDWMKGVMSDEKGVMPIKARLKGDWLDHLRGKKWSIRVKMRDDYTFNRMKVFSLQNPATRYYLHEYLAHKLFSKNDVLTTRYGFIPMYFNGKSLGIYAWEEHFSKQLIESNLRREGPIMKFDEDPFWRMQQHAKVSDEWLQLPYYETSRVVAFGLNKILKKPVLAQQFQIAQGLMYQYKNQTAPIDEIFNIDAYAKYWAIIDIVNGKHGIAWHNQRMYYNPVICKLEPINFDDFTEDSKNPADISALTIESKGTVYIEELFLNHIFSSKEFINLYIKYLEYYTNENQLKKFIESEKESLDHFENMIQEENERYEFNNTFLLENANLIRRRLPELKKKLAEGYFNNFQVKAAPKVADTGFHPALTADYINAFYYPIEAGTAQMRLENYTGRTIEVIGLADNKQRMVHLIDQPIFLSPYVNDVKDTTILLSYNELAAYLAFRVNEHEEIMYSELSLWEKNTGLSPYQKLLHSSDYTRVGLFEERGDSLIVKSGKYQLSEKVMIPADKILVFEANIELDIIKNAAIISYAPVFMNGEKDKPIHIYSSDSTANAFTVLQASGRSKLDYVVFSHLNTLSYEGWNLTGAVNFYESDVDVSNCVFEYNHCEDALNIVRSDFLVTQSEFLNIYSDAFDSDFCTGTLENSTFQYVGNDAIDFSTSQIKIDYCNIKNISDKGISGGEGSTLSVLNTTILDCNIGAASKDLSVVDLQNVSIENCNYGLVALQKKPEYGPAILKGKKLKLINCTKKYLIEKRSVLHINGRKVDGTQKKVAELFY